MAIAFEKWHGLGNDFVLMARDALADEDACALALRVCDRRRGVGADGLLLVDRRSRAMVVFNADGSRPEMCGNGLRCAAASIAAFETAGEGGWSATFATDAGARHTEVRPTELAQTWEVAVEMGQGRGGLPTGTPATLAAEGFGAGHVVDVGNPHWLFIGGPAERERLLEAGGELERHPAFPSRTNVEVLEPVEDGSWRLTVWERGCGPTQACGTAACAAGWLLAHLGHVGWGEPVVIRLPGGPLEIVPRDSGITMTGPAVRVFTGTWVGSDG